MVGTSIDLDKYKPEKVNMNYIGKLIGDFYQHFVRATAFSSGSQFDRVEVEGKSFTRVTMLNQVDLNSWVPSSVVNSAMASTLYQMAQNIRKHARDDSIFTD